MNFEENKQQFVVDVEINGTRANVSKRVFALPHLASGRLDLGFVELDVKGVDLSTETTITFKIKPVPGPR